MKIILITFCFSLSLIISLIGYSQVSDSNIILSHDDENFIIDRGMNFREVMRDDVLQYQLNDKGDNPHRSTVEFKTHSLNNEIHNDHSIQFHPDDQYYDNRFFIGGLDWTVFASVVKNGELFLGGNFEWVDGEIELNGIARWDGNNFHPVGEGFNGTVYAVTIYNTDLVAAGVFFQSGDNQVNRIARWDGTSWQQMGEGFNGSVRALVEYNGELIAGGTFTHSGNTQVNRIARWDGSSWQPLGDGFNDWVLTLTEYNGDLIAGGWFTESNDNQIERIARWDGSSWQEIGEGFNWSVETVIEYNGELIAGGTFTHSGNIQVNRIARWDGSSWQPLDDGFNGTVLTLTDFNGELIAGGVFTHSGNVQVNHIARWDGVNWQRVGVLGFEYTSSIRTFSIFNDNLVVGGFFFDLLRSIQNIALYNGDDWVTVGGRFTGGLGVNSWTRSLLVAGDYLYLGGIFTIAGDQRINSIARWDGLQWESLGDGFNSTVYSINIYDGDIIAGGTFSRSGDNQVNRIARWDGTSWQQMGEGFNGSVRVLVEYNGELIAGGTFTQSGNTQVNRIARWDGSNWKPLGDGFNDWVLTLTEYNGDLIAGGWFTESGDHQIDHIARWSGDSWEQVGEGFNGSVRALVEYNGDLIAGGGFLQSGNSTMYFIARWDGSSWQQLGDGFNGSVEALTTYNGELVAGGWFTRSDNTQVNYLSRWNEDFWKPFGSGTSGTVYEVISYNDDLFFTGSFQSAGNHASARIGRWSEISEYVSLGDAIGQPNWEIDTGGDAEWFGQQSTYYSDGVAARSGSISHNEESWMQTSISVPGGSQKTLSFWWKVSSEQGYDFLEFYINDERLDRISGEVDWHQKLYTLDEGTYVIKWRYVKDHSFSDGLDCGWVDKVELKMESVPKIVVSPDIIADTLFPGDISTNIMKISNEGDGGLEFSLTWSSELVTSFSIPSGRLSSHNILEKTSSFDHMSVDIDAIDVKDTFDLPKKTHLKLPSQASSSEFGYITEQNILYDSGPFVNSPGTGPGGADQSILQNSLGMNALGFNNGTSTGFRIADEFSIHDSTGWMIDKFIFWGYQTGTGTTSTFNHVNYRIWDGIPGDPASNLIFEDDVSNRLIHTEWSGVYRVSENNINTERPIMMIVASAGFHLDQGTYWVDWQTDGTAGTTWNPPITIDGEVYTGDAIQYHPSEQQWTTITDSGTNTPQGMPFLVVGVADSIDWLSATPVNGVVSSGETMEIEITLNAAGLLPGDYHADIKIISNDSDNPVVTVPVILTVLDEEPISPPAAPVLSSPLDNAIDVSIDTTLLRWHASDGAESYHVQLAAETITAEKIVDETEIEDTSFVVMKELDYGTEYYWRVRAKNQGGESDWSSVWSFTTLNKILQIEIPVSTTAWRANSTYHIVWESQGINKLNLEYRIDDDYGWEPIVESFVDAATGEHQWSTPNTSTTECRIRISDEENQEVFSISDPFTIYTSNFDISFNKAFDDPSKTTSARLIALPGDIDLPLDDILEGEPGRDWKAAFDDGTETDYLVEYDGSSRFNLRPGRGFWIISKNNISIQQEEETVKTYDGQTYSIPLHYGWNIISNPYDKTLQWEAVQVVNNLQNDPIWSFVGNYVTSSEFEPYTGYYFYNRNDLDSLKIPYNDDVFLDKISEEKIVNINKLSIGIQDNGVLLTSIEIGHLLDEDDNVSTYNQYAPPGNFQNVQMLLKQQDLKGRSGELLREIRIESGEGETYDLHVRANEKGYRSFLIEGLEAFNDSEVYLVDRRTGRFYDLHRSNEITLMLEDGVNRFYVLIGGNAFIENQRHEILPEVFTLHQNYPNPFNSMTKIEYSIPSDINEVPVLLEVYNMLGQRVSVLVDENQQSGLYSVTFNGGNLSSGMYIYRLRAGKFVDSKRFIFIK